MAHYAHQGCALPDRSTFLGIENDIHTDRDTETPKRSKNNRNFGFDVAFDSYDGTEIIYNEER